MAGGKGERNSCSIPHECHHLDIQPSITRSLKFSREAENLDFYKTMGQNKTRNLLFKPRFAGWLSLQPLGCWKARWAKEQETGFS